MGTGKTNKRHVPLITIAPLAQVILEPGVDGCPVCADIGMRREDVQDSIDAYKAVAPRIIDVERTMLGLQQELRGIRDDMTRAVRLMKRALVSHPRCRSCGILIGPGHVANDLVREPLGEILVCPTCRAWLDDAGTTVAAQVIRERHGDDLDGRQT